MNRDNLISRNIAWYQHNTCCRYYYYQDEVTNRIVLLRMNNFPDEPLYTIIDGLDIFDIEDKPDGWVLQEINPLRRIE
jgi:hypothetical protein